MSLGVAAAAALRPLLEDVSAVRSGGFRVFPGALALVAGLAVVTGVLAALVPAVTSSRQDVVTALAGRRGITRSRRRWLVLGAALAAAGAASAGWGAWRMDWATIFLGLVVIELGLVLCTPGLVGLVGRLGRVLAVAPRIALRDTSRNRTAAAPAISAVMAAVVGSLAIGVILIASNERQRDEYRSVNQPGDVAVYPVGAGPKGTTVTQQVTTPEVVDVLRSTMPIEQLHQVGQPGCDTGCFVQVSMPEARACPYELIRDPTRAQQRSARRDARCDGVGNRYTYFGGLSSDSGGMTFVIDETAAGAVPNLPVRDADRVEAAMRSGAVVVDDARNLENGRVTLALKEGFVPSDVETRTVTAPGFALSERAQVPIAVMTEETARSLGLFSTPTLTFATTSRMPTVEEQDRAQAALGERFDVRVEKARAADGGSLVVLAVVAAAVTLAAAAIATGLAAADGRAGLATLAVVGASPRVRRALSLSQAGVIAGLGSLLGVIAGLAVSTAVLFALNQREADLWPAPAPYPITVPWLNVVIALIVVPGVAMLGAGLMTRSRLPIERRL